MSQPAVSESNSTQEVRLLESALIIPIELIDPNPFQPRHDITEADVAELTASIQAKGLIEPLIVAARSNRYTLIAGYRRLTASKIAGISEVPCIIREGSEPELLELALLENIQRADLTPIEEAESYKKLMEVAKIDQEAVARKMNKSTGTVSTRLSLLALPKDIKEMLNSGNISIRAALEVGRIGNDSLRTKIAAKADFLKFNELKSRVQKANENKPRKKHEKRVAHPSFKDIFEGLPVKRVYKDQVTFVFQEEEEFISALRKIIERYDLENRVA